MKNYIGRVPGLTAYNAQLKGSRAEQRAPIICL